MLVVADVHPSVIPVVKVRWWWCTCGVEGDAGCRMGREVKVRGCVQMRKNNIKSRRWRQRKRGKLKDARLTEKIYT